MTVAVNFISDPISAVCDEACSAPPVCQAIKGLRYPFCFSPQFFPQSELVTRLDKSHTADCELAFSTVRRSFFMKDATLINCLRLSPVSQP